MPGRRSKKKKSKKPRKQRFVEKEEDVKAPHSFVIKRGIVTKPVTELMTDVRQILEPFTASNLKVRKQNVVKDFVAVASALSVTHIAMFTMTDQAVYLKLCRLPRGPTITFKIREFTTAREVRSSLRKPVIFQGMFRKQPLLVMNGFSGESMELKLTSSMWRNMFPAFDINTVDLNDIRRCLLLNYDEETGCISLRHYAIRVKPVGLAKGTRKIVSSKKVPDLGKFKDIGDFMARDNNAGSATESEGEADEVEEFRQVTLSQKIRTRGNLINEKSAIRLTEIGPRVTMQLFKMEEGLMEGEVLYHSVIKKTKKESKELADRKKRQQEEKAKRKAEQEANVRAKRLKEDPGTGSSSVSGTRRGILKNGSSTRKRDQEGEEDGGEGEQSVEDKNQDDGDEMNSYGDDDDSDKGDGDASADDDAEEEEEEEEQSEED